MLLLVPAGSLIQRKGGFFCYDVDNNKILWQYVHDKKWMRVDWRGGVLYKDYFIACDWQDIYYFNTTNWEFEDFYSRNYFNDLHYLAVHNDNLYVVNTGLDSVEIFQNPLNPLYTNTHYIFNTHYRYFEQRDIDRSKDYSSMFKLEHSCHPNGICFLDDYVFVSCYEPGNCVIDIVTGKIVVNNVPCHDVIHYKQNLYVTATNNRRVRIFNDILNRSWPAIADDYIELNERAWWRGGVIKDGFMVLFGSSDLELDKPAKVAIIDLTTKTVDIRVLPTFEDINWGIIYQPVIYV